MMTIINYINTFVEDSYLTSSFTIMGNYTMLTIFKVHTYTCSAVVYYIRNHKYDYPTRRIYSYNVEKSKLVIKKNIISRELMYESTERDEGHFFRSHNFTTICQCIFILCL